jgi:hypothetical protein
MSLDLSGIIRDLITILIDSTRAAIVINFPVTSEAIK